MDLRRARGSCGSIRRAVHLLEAGSTVHFDANRPHRLGTADDTVEVIVVAADAPNDFRNHPLFSASIGDH